MVKYRMTNSFFLAECFAAHALLAINGLLALRDEHATNHVGGLRESDVIPLVDLLDWLQATIDLINHH